MKIIIIITLQILLLVHRSWTQIPTNIIPNHSFENFSGTFPNSLCRRPLDAGSFDLLNWKPGWEPRPGDLDNNEINTPDWHSFIADNIFINCMPCKSNGINPFGSDKYIFIGKDNTSRHGESFYTEMISELQNGKKYKFRIVAMGEPFSKFNIHFSKSGVNWHHADLAHENMMNALGFTIPTGPFLIDSCSPRVYEGVITANKNRLYHIVIHAVGTSYEDHSFLNVDDLELYEYCTESIVRQGRFYKYKS